MVVGSTPASLPELRPGLAFLRGETVGGMHPQDEMSAQPSSPGSPREVPTPPSAASKALAGHRQAVDGRLDDA